MGKTRYLIIQDDDVVAEIEERDVVTAKKDWGDDPNILIARVVWESEPEKTPVTYPVPEGECLDGLLNVQEK